MKPLTFDSAELWGCCAIDLIARLNTDGSEGDEESNLDFRRALLATTSNRDNKRSEINSLKRLGFKEIVRFKRIDGRKATIRVWYRKPTKTKPKKLIKTPKHRNEWERFL